jgi:O-antigen ligase
MTRISSAPGLLGAIPRLHSSRRHQVVDVVPWALRESTLSATFAFLVVVSAYVFAISHGDLGYQVVSQIVLILFAMGAILLRPAMMQFSREGIARVALLGTVLLSNLLVNAENYSLIGADLGYAFMHVIGIVAFAFVAQWAVYALRPELIFSYIAIFLSPLLLWVIYLGFADSYTFRLSPLGLHPNWWGEVAFALALGALSIKQVYIRILLLTIAVVAMYFVQSRGALLGVGVAYMTYLGMSVRILSKRPSSKLMLIAFGLTVCMVLVAMLPLGEVVVEFVMMNVLFVDDPYRGVDTGLTGRLDGWRAAIEVFLGEPFFGRGIDTLMDVHNGFLRWAGEGGVMLVTAMLFLIIGAMLRALKMKNIIVISVLFGMLAYMMTYPRALNVNLVGFSFMLTLFPWKRSKGWREMDDFGNSVLGSRLMAR